MIDFAAVHEAAARGPRRRVVVAGAALPSVLEALADPLARRLAEPVLVGPEAAVRAVAGQVGADLAGVRIVDEPGDDEAVGRRAVAEVREGRGEALMKGAVATAALLHAVMDRARGLRGAGRLSHVAVVQHPGYPKLSLHSDGGINHHLDEATLRDVVANAVGLARALGREAPRVACLALVEKVDPNLPETAWMEAIARWAPSALPGVVAAGPVGIDMAWSAGAAALKGLESPVAGDADVFAYPSITACNFTVKSLYTVAGAEVAGLVLGARAPIVLLSRADPPATRLHSLALAAVHAGGGPLR